MLVGKFDCPYEKLSDGRWGCPLCHDVARAYPVPPTRRCPKLRPPLDAQHLANLPPEPARTFESGRAKAKRDPCMHRGQCLRHVSCPSCAGEVRVKVLACAIHGECTVGKRLDSVMCCAACGDYEQTEDRRPEAGQKKDQKRS